MAKPAGDNGITLGHVGEQPHLSTVMVIVVWAHALLHAMGLEAEEALSVAGLDWLPRGAQLFEEGEARE